jgi:hypothetical protein
VVIRPTGHPHGRHNRRFDDNRAHVDIIHAVDDEDLQITLTGGDVEMTTNVKLLVLALAVALIQSECRAGSLTWDFSYTISNGTDTSSVSMGTLTTTSVTNADGQYTITGISGTFSLNASSTPITGLLPPGSLGNNDNLLSPTSPHLTHLGVTYAIDPISGFGRQLDAVNTFTNNSTYVNALGVQGSSFVNEIDGNTVSEFHLSLSSVPEPSSAIVALSGAVVLGAAFGWSRHRRAQRQKAAA